jgi:hypothetical protein
MSRPPERPRAAPARLAAAVLAGALLAASGCSVGDSEERGDGGSGTPATADGDGGSPTTGGAAPTGPSAADLCAGAAVDPAAVAVAAADLTETSGIGAGRTSAGVLWAHNDSGGAPEVFAVGADGADLGRYALDGAEARDWEDMAVGPGDDGTGVLYLGDIGDNTAVRPSVTVYRAPEPAVAPGGAGGSIVGVEALPLTYADGARDAEALLADPVTGDLFVVSKEWGGGPTGAYRIPAGSAAGEPVTMARAGDVAVTPGELVTGGDVSPDGSLVALRTYGEVLLWDRGPDQTVAEALSGTPCAAPVEAEAQGEAVALDPDGRGYVTVSEGQNPRINRFRLP